MLPGMEHSLCLFLSVCVCVCVCLSVCLSLSHSQRQINAGKMEEAQKLADMERRINEDVYFLTHERDHYKTELNRY